MKYPDYSLRTALLAFVLLPLLVLAALAGGYSLHSLEQQIKSRMQEDIKLVARSIRLPLSHALEQKETAPVTRALDSVFRIGRVYGAYVYDADGNQIAASGPRRPSMDSRKAAQLVSDGDRQGEYEDVGGEEVFSYFVPLTDSGGRINGLLQVTRRGSDFQNYIARVREQTLLLLLGTGVLLATVVLYGHQRAIGGHFRTLLQGMARVGGGDRGHRVPAGGPREVRELARGMNAMLDNLSHQEEALTRQRAEQAALEARLHQSEKMAAIGRLAAGLAHELGTPLNVVDGTAQRTLRMPNLPEPVSAVLQKIRLEVQRMSHIVRQLMDFGRSNPLQFRIEHVKRLLHGSVAQHAELARELGIEVEVAPPARKEVMVSADRLRMEQALTNLLRNALQVARQRVHIGWFETPQARGFFVEDDGPGVQEDQLDRIFEPFYTTKPVNEGTGLGLAVAHAAVRDHGGTIQVEDSALGGARLRILLPPPDDEAVAGGNVS